jgi:hypothetical protein
MFAHNLSLEKVNKLLNKAGGERRKKFTSVRDQCHSKLLRRGPEFTHVLFGKQRGQRKGTVDLTSHANSNPRAHLPKGSLA